VAAGCYSRARASGRLGARTGAQRRLRTWFDHVPERFDPFRRRYREELGARSESIDLRRRAASGTVTIVYAARDRQHNDAVVLAELVRKG